MEDGLYYGGLLKLAQFLWRACSASLAAQGRLSNAILPHMETIVHAIFEYSDGGNPCLELFPFLLAMYTRLQNTLSSLFEWMMLKRNKDNWLTFTTMG